MVSRFALNVTYHKWNYYIMNIFVTQTQKIDRISEFNHCRASNLQQVPDRSQRMQDRPGGGDRGVHVQLRVLQEAGHGAGDLH